MRVFVAGASGVVGRFLVPALVRRGHDVLGMVRSESGAAAVAALGGRAVRVDAFDAAAIDAVVGSARPDVVIHQLTALPRDTSLRDFARTFAPTNRLRTEALDNLVAAARKAGARRFVAQSFCGWPYARVGGPVKDEDDPLDPDPPAAFRSTLDALRRVEDTMRLAKDLRGVALRYGSFYGPGTIIGRDGPLVRQVRRRRAPLIGAGSGVWSFIHLADVAGATDLAAEGDATGTFNVVDDEPATVASWLPFLARSIGASPPLRLPDWIGRVLLPEHLYLMMTAVRGGWNRRFKQAFGWQPEWPSWRDGFGEAIDAA